MSITRAIKVTTTGGAGVATGAGRIGISPARLAGIQVDYTSQPATTDVTVKCVFAGITKTLLTLTNANTDVPLRSITEVLFTDVNVAVPVTESPNRGLPIVGGEIVVDVAQGDAATDGVKVTLLLEPL